MVKGDLGWLSFSAHSRASKRIRLSLHIQCRTRPCASGASWKSSYVPLPKIKATAFSLCTPFFCALEQTASLMASTRSATTCTLRTGNGLLLRPLSPGIVHLTLPLMASRTSSTICIAGSLRGWLEVNTTSSQYSASAQPYLALSPRRTSPSQPRTEISRTVPPSLGWSHSLTATRASRTSWGVEASWYTAHIDVGEPAVCTSSTPGGGPASSKAERSCSRSAASEAQVASAARQAPSAPRAADAPISGSRSVAVRPPAALSLR
mmetsp:Transcript_93654/g.264831  ORF Transcript_93654/g.264831 Transcript_93654/m.264831 type:complete len:264 (-) Transcript_93654:658-1449(-)